MLHLEMWRVRLVVGLLLRMKCCPREQVNWQTWQHCKVWKHLGRLSGTKQNALSRPNESLEHYVRSGDVLKVATSQTFCKILWTHGTATESNCNEYRNPPLHPPWLDPLCQQQTATFFINSCPCFRVESSFNVRLCCVATIITWVAEPCVSQGFYIGLVNPFSREEFRLWNTFNLLLTRYQEKWYDKLTMWAKSFFHDM